MFDELLVYVIVDDLHREADNNRLINIANRSRKIQRRQRLVKLARRFGLTEDFSYEEEKQNEIN